MNWCPGEVDERKSGQLIGQGVGQDWNYYLFLESLRREGREEIKIFGGGFRCGGEVTTGEDIMMMMLLLLFCRMFRT